jgi:hypothetical protein
MFSLQELLGQEGGDQALNQISQSVGADHGAVSSAVQMALPLIVGAMAKNAQDPAGAQSLDNAVQEHDGSLLDNIGGIATAALAANGGGILSNILGGSKQDAAASQISQSTGLSSGQVMQILMMLAPIVMSYLGRQKQQQGLDASGLSNMLSQQTQQAQSAGNPMMNMVSGFLDANHDGSALDDIAGMAMNYFKR